MTQGRRTSTSKGLSAQEIDSKIETAIAGILERLQKIEDRASAGIPPIENLRGLVAAEVGKLTPRASLAPATPATQPLDRGLFPCIASLSKREHHERLRVLVEQ